MMEETVMSILNDVIGTVAKTAKQPQHILQRRYGRFQFDTKHTTIYRFQSFIKHAIATLYFDIEMSHMHPARTFGIQFSFSLQDSNGSISRWGENGRTPPEKKSQNAQEKLG